MPIRTAILFLLAFAAVTAAQVGYVCVSQPIIIHERIGDTIDKEERLYFNLFPNVDDFESAVFTGDHSDSSYLVTVYREGHEIVYSMLIQGDLYRNLHRYIDSYEEILHDCSSQNSLRRWQLRLQAALDTKLVDSLQLTSSTIVEVNAGGNDEVQGVLLHANDSTLFIGDPSSINEVAAIPYMAIERLGFDIETEIEDGAALGFGIGLLLGTMLGTAILESTKYPEDELHPLVVGVILGSVFTLPGLLIGSQIENGTYVEVDRSHSIYTFMLPKLKSRMLLPHPPPRAWFR